MPAPVVEAQRLLAVEPAARKSARREIDRLWDAAQRLGVAEAGPSVTALARAAIHLEALRRALRLLGALEAGIPDAQLWDTAPAEVRAALALPEAEVPLVARAVAHGLDADGATPPPVEAIARAHANAAAKLNAEDRLVGEYQLKRIVRAGFGLTVAAAVAVLVVALVTRLAQPTDLAAGLPFKVSSVLAECHPEQNECAGASTRILFHTREEANPWYLVDLLKPTDFTRMTIVNRGDSAEARAIPLVVEVSDDGATFREVARQTDVFATWKPELGPQHARYVRLRVDRTSWLHLEAVRIHP